ncbi:hypothetical protein AB0E00_00760 [Streptomyces sp. NPDC048110]|uniref:hypothetical protein n=1 Tax=Streptomyces sp. NPDC048110 TaxID=3155483 RepID=UPI00340103B1
MPLSVEEIADMAQKGSLKLRADHFADPVVSDVFSTHLACSELEFKVLEYTEKSMTARGHCAVRALGKEPCRAVATFLRADPPDGTVVGFTLLVDAPGWRLPEPFPAFDLSPLRSLGAQSLVAAFNAVPGTNEEGGEKEQKAEKEAAGKTGAEAEEAGQEQTSVPSRAPVLSGARWKVPDLAEPVLFLASAQKDQRTLEGKLTVGSAEIEARTEESQDPKSWKLDAKAESISFSDISTLAEQTMGSGLPASLAGLTLQELGFTVESTESERKFEAKASAEFPLTPDVQTQVGLDMKIAIKDGTAEEDTGEDAPAAKEGAAKEETNKDRAIEVTVKGSFALGPKEDEEPSMRFDLEADRDPESVGLTATSVCEDGIPLGKVLAALLPASASPTEGLPNLLPPVKKISLRYTAPKAPDVASLLLTAETPRGDEAVLVLAGRNGGR